MTKIKMTVGSRQSKPSTSSDDRKVTGQTFGDPVRKIKAKFAGSCDECSGSIKVDETIWWDSITKETNHYRCGRPDTDPDERSHQQALAHRRDLQVESERDGEKTCMHCYMIQPIASFTDGYCGACY